jgi:P4 family phage/plasmid primase-like protien
VILANGGKVDVLVGPHQMVLPLSVVVTSEGGQEFRIGGYKSASEAGYCDESQDGWLLVDRLGDLPEYPIWAWPKEMLKYAPTGAVAGEVPAGLEALADTIAEVVAPEPREPREPGDGDELTEKIDALPLLDMIAEAGVPGTRGDDDSCGCKTWLRHESDAEKSITIHDGCPQYGHGVRVWTTGIEGLPQGTHSRLDAYIGLVGGDIKADRGKVMDWLGLTTPKVLSFAERLFMAAELFEDRAESETWCQGGAFTAPDPDGVPQLHSGGWRTAGRQVQVHQTREYWLELAAKCAAGGRTVRENKTGRGLAVAAPAAGDPAAGLPAVDPYMDAFKAYAADELARGVAPIEPANSLAAQLIPGDIRSLREAVRGPRACAQPVDVEGTHGLLAEAIGAAVGGSKLRYTTDLEDWYEWNGKAWELNKAAARVAVQGLLNRSEQSADPVVRQRMIRAYTWKKLTLEQKAKFVKFHDCEIDLETGTLFGPDGSVIEMIPTETPTQAESTPVQNGVIAQLGVQERVATRTSEFDSDPAVLGTPGGYIVLGADGFSVTRPDPAKLVSKLTGAAYDAQAEALLFEAAMKAALPDGEVRGFLQRVTGQALYGEQEHHILVNLRGTGGNGKGLYQDVIEAILGAYAVKLPASVLTLAGANNHATDLLPLRGARIALINEVPASQLNEDRAKELTGGGTATARGIAKDPVTWLQTHTLIMSTNNQLTWRPSAYRAMARRLLEIKFEVDFGAEGGPKMVEGLADRIVREEAAGVLNWCLAGYADYVARGRKLDPPAKVLEWTRETLAQSSSWASFCDEMFEVTRAASDQIPVSLIWSMWNRFRSQDTDQRHVTPGSDRAVAGAMVNQLPGVTHLKSAGKRRATVCGVKWSAAGVDMQQAIPSEVYNSGGPQGYVMMPPPAAQSAAVVPPIGTLR